MPRATGTPRKKEARTQSKAKSNDTTDEELRKLVKMAHARTTRMLRSHFVEEGARSVSDLWKSVPERAIFEIRKPNISVSEGNDRMGTGFFDIFDQSIMQEIFFYCGLLAKIACLTSICKAWRGYKTIPGPLRISASI